MVTSELHNRYLPALFFLLQLYLSYKTNFKASPLWCISHSSVIMPEIELTPFCFILPKYPINSNLFFSTLHHQRRSTFYSCVSSPVQFSSVQSLSHVRIFATPWTATGQASLSIINSRSLPKLMSIELEKTYNHLILTILFSSCPQSLPASEYFPMSQLLAWGGQITGVSAWASVLPMNTQDWSPLGWTGWISLQSKGLSRLFSNTTIHKH